MTATPAPAPDDDGPLHVLVRVWLPDRPGALGLVASRIGAVEGDIVGIDVLEQGDGVAVDEFAVLLRRSVSLDLLVREILEVDGTKVEEVRTIGHFPDPRLDALESATSLCQAKTADDLPQVLVEHIRDEFLADWSLLMADGAVRATAGEPGSRRVDDRSPGGRVRGVAEGGRRHHRARRPRPRRVAHPRRHPARGP